jgi:hypothetical protein
MKVVPEAGHDYGLSYSWIPKRLGNPSIYGLYLFHDTYNTEACLSFDFCSDGGGLKCFSPFSGGSQPSESILLTCFRLLS